ncbi:sigma factor-like helix-turn-helix DNA-binding protein [Brevibacillus centrosporus]|uniref:sigma factor-like helix-turn-helix DNA-binding protein n=1 Tax=Brevibacillus centrosporus TaxID=54910 RepID=UPI003985E282
MSEWSTMEELLEEYKQTRNKLRYKYSKLSAAVVTGSDEADASLMGYYSDMIGDLDYVITWMETGKRPGNKRGIERLAVYQRTVTMDPIILQSYVNRTVAGGPSNITDSQRELIGEALSCLTDREKDCYVMAHGQGFSQYDIARMLGLSRGTVDTYIRRAQEKISKKLNLKKPEYSLSKKVG